MSVYWQEQAPWDPNETIKVRECKNGCKQVVYFNEHTGKFCNFNDGEQHDCPNFKKSSNSQTGSSQGNKNQAQNTHKSPQSGNNTSRPVQQQQSTTSTGLEILLKGQLDELRSAVGHLSRIAMFAESLDFRVKKIQESLTYSKVPERPILTPDEPSEQEQTEKKDFNPTDEELATGYTNREMEELK